MAAAAAYNPVRELPPKRLEQQPKVEKENEKFAVLFLGSMIPVLGTIPSALGALYFGAKMVQKCAEVCFRGLRAWFNKDAPNKAKLNEAKKELKLNGLLFTIFTAGTVTLGLSTILVTYLLRNKA